MAIRAWARIRPDPAVSVPLLSNVLKDADPTIRTEAMAILAEIGKPAVPTLVRLLNREKSAYWCCIVLGEMGADAADAAPALVEVLQGNPRPEVRREAALALGLIGPAAADSVPALTQALGENDTAIAAGAAYALGRIGPKAKTADLSLAKCAASPDPLLRTISVWAMAKIAPQNEARKQVAVGRLVAALKAKQPQLRHAALRGLADLQPAPDAVLPALKQIVHDPDKTMAIAAVHVLASLGDPAVPALIDALKHEELRPVTANILGHMGPGAKAAVPALVDIVKTDDAAAARSEALLALAAIGADAAEVVPAAVEALHAPQEDVCCAACFTLGQIGKPAVAAEPELLKKLGDTNESTSLAAAWAMVRINPDSPETARQLVPLLVRALTDCEPRVRVEAAASLQLLGSRAKEALPALRQATTDRDEMARAAAVAALNAISDSATIRK
jgi:HEAT repeat protein